jgi:hypothetical protein
VLDKDFAAAAELKDFDERLTELWGDRFGPMKDDCDGKPPEECCAYGMSLLDWSHDRAHQETISIRPSWSHAFLVRGSMQQLSEEGEIGWHPDYVNKLAALKAKVP